jgi:hypothetical protein
MCRLLEMRRCWTTAASSASYGIPAKAWWNSPDDPNIRLLKETLLDAQYWDAPGATVAHVKMATAALTGAKPSMEREPKSRHKINDEGTNQIERRKSQSSVLLATHVERVGQCQPGMERREEFWGGLMVTQDSRRRKRTGGLPAPVFEFRKSQVLGATPSLGENPTRR